MKIAFFDSGIGGLTVIKEALKLFPYENYIYFADSLNAPYGNKSTQQVEGLLIDAFDFIAEQKVDILVLACHTASKLLNKKFYDRYDFPIIGMHSGIRNLNPTNGIVKTVISGTDLSIGKWENQMIEFGISASYISLQNLVLYAENFEFDSQNIYVYLNMKLALIDWSNYDSFVLGCTHFPFFKKQIKQIIPKHVRILDGSKLTARKLKLYITQQTYGKDKSIDFIVSKKKVSNDIMMKYLDVLETENSRALSLLNVEK